MRGGLARFSETCPPHTQNTVHMRPARGSEKVAMVEQIEEYHWHDDSQKAYEKLEQRDASLLSLAGFDSVGGGFWIRGGVLFSKQAGLQYALRELRDEGESSFFKVV